MTVQTACDQSYWQTFRDQWQTKTRDERQSLISSWTEEELHAVDWWHVHYARDKQLPPLGDWRIWLLLTGRGFGKTRAGAEWVRAQIDSGCRRIALVGPTAADVRDVMIEGDSGILSCCPTWNRPLYEPSKRRITWKSGAIATAYSADEPERLRGPQHDGAWCDEIAAWRRGQESWDMLMFGLRLGNNPRCVVTTTPKPKKLIRDLITYDHVAVVRGSTYENRENLADAFYAQIVARYEGTALGQQELYGDILEEVPGALWTRGTIEQLRVKPAPEMKRVLVAIDPAVTATKKSDETGIIVVGSLDGHAYVLDDLSGRWTPEQWGRKAIEAYYRWKADAIIAEVNQGGDLVEANLRTLDRTVSYRSVSAMRGKMVRAEPVASLYEQGRVHHVGVFPELEDQLCNWDGDTDWSPDRLDALVHAVSNLVLGIHVPTDVEALSWG